MSERTGFFSLMSTKRRSEPRTRIVCGSPAVTSSSAPSMPGIGALSLLKMPDELVDLEQAGGRDGRGRAGDDEERADGGAHEQAAAGPRRLLVVVERAHREPSGYRPLRAERSDARRRSRDRRASGGSSACAAACSRPSTRPAACATRRVRRRPPSWKSSYVRPRRCGRRSEGSSRIGGDFQVVPCDAVVLADRRPRTRRAGRRGGDRRRGRRSCRRARSRCGSGRRSRAARGVDGQRAAA